METIINAKFDSDVITRHPTLPYETHYKLLPNGNTMVWYQYLPNYLSFVQISFVQNPSFSTGRSKDPPGMRGHNYGPERDDLINNTCTDRLEFVVPWCGDVNGHAQ